MGNSKLAAGCHISSDAKDIAPTSTENGILGQIHGQYIAAAIGTLGRPTREAQDRHEVIVEAGHAGTIRLFIEKKRARHGRYSHYYWSAYRAEQAND
ncbi:hypothetical protein Tamer19_72500 [Cupriavidus sp. TA19]|uniref:hypothetical protein n=1 Tax=Cupriavidus sp. TA19 TaxID=701108 RepID=UPI002729406A|nr:hypothetical protein [Cupriavidus sp. TA19]GLC97841.1 hypothetical protein Tamer19_72500 [Cupriavidus sp. TA19]